MISNESEEARNKWPLGRVVQVYPSEDGLVKKSQGADGRRRFG